MVALALIPGSVLCGCGNGIHNENLSNTAGSLGLPAAQTQQWVEQIGGMGVTVTCPTATFCTPATDVGSETTDPSGNVVISGFSPYTMPGQASGNEFGGPFVAKYSTSGGLLWTRQFSPNNSAGGYAVVFANVTDSSGNIYAGGYTTGEFPGYPNPHHDTLLLLAKLDPFGNILSIQTYDTGLLLINIVGESIVLLPSGNIAFGWTSASLQIGSNDSSFFYVVDPSSGDEVWHRSYPGYNEMATMVSDASGDLIATGVSVGGIFPGVPNGGGGLPWIVKFDGTTGNIVWEQSFTDYLAKDPAHIAIDQIVEDVHGDIFAGGAIASPTSLLCSGLCDTPNVTGQGAFIAKLSATTGNVLWTKVVATGAGDGVTGVAADSAGNLFAVGFTNGLLADGFTQPIDNLFALKLDTDGNPIWAQQFGTGPWMYGLGPPLGLQAATDASGDLFVSSVTEGAFPGISNSTTQGEVFVIKFGP